VFQAALLFDNNYLFNKKKVKLFFRVLKTAVLSWSAGGGVGALCQKVKK
jgi:hypothetical protein